jgi:hypothetical protein
MKPHGSKDDHNESRAPTRKEWVKPEMKVISAGSAELNAGFTDDGFDVS